MKNYMIRQNALTDAAKLAGLERFIHKEYPFIGFMAQPYLCFEKGEDRFLGWYDSLNREQVKKYRVAHPDGLLVSLVCPANYAVLELDGKIHHIKTKGTEERNKLYKLNMIPCIRIDEENLKLRLKVGELTQVMLNEEFKRLFDEF